MLSRFLALCLALCTAVVAVPARQVVAAYPAKVLGVGDKAPILRGVHWLKGDKVQDFLPGKFYIVDVWATWCGPCVKSIPTINGLQKKYKDSGLTVIGVAISDEESTVKRFVSSQGDAMSYTVAADVNDIVSKGWLDAAGRDTIPTAFLIDREGKIAFVGHPESGLDAAVAKVARTKFDGDKTHTAEKAASKDAGPLSGKDEINAALKAGDYQKVRQLAEAAIKLNPDQPATQIALYIATLKLDGQAKAAAFAKQLIDGPFASNFDNLNQLAWAMVDPASPQLKANEHDAVSAIAASEKAVALTRGTDPFLLNTLARAYFVKGDTSTAIKTQLKAVDAAKGDAKNQFKTPLEEYRAAAKR